MPYNVDVEVSNNRTTRFVVLCGTLLILGFLFFLFKIESCKSSPETCKDEYFEINENAGAATLHTCNQGAHVELVGPPLYPKRGVLCHCGAAPSSSVK